MAKMNYYSSSFPSRLYSMLEDAPRQGFEDVVAWLPTGDGFVIFDFAAFEERIMKAYFQQTQWKSFLRQLNMYSFQRLSKRGKGKEIVYSHPCLVRGDISKCRLMRRSSKANKQKKNSDAEPSRAVSPSPPPSEDLLDKAEEDVRFRSCSFPVRLYLMLEDAPSQGFEEVVSWLPSGDGFVIHDRATFEGGIMKTYFAHSQWKSFLRQLNAYSFTRCSKRGGGKDSYAHSCLVRGDMSKFKFMQRCKRKGAGSGGVQESKSDDEESPSPTKRVMATTPPTASTVLPAPSISSVDIIARGQEESTIVDALAKDCLPPISEDSLIPALASVDSEGGDCLDQPFLSSIEEVTRRSSLDLYSSCSSVIPSMTTAMHHGDYYYGGYYCQQHQAHVMRELLFSSSSTPGDVADTLAHHTFWNTTQV